MKLAVLCVPKSEKSEVNFYLNIYKRFEYFLSSWQQKTWIKPKWQFVVKVTFRRFKYLISSHKALITAKITNTLMALNYILMGFAIWTDNSLTQKMDPNILDFHVTHLHIVVNAIFRWFKYFICCKFYLKKNSLT